MEQDREITDVAQADQVPLRAIVARIAESLETIVRAEVRLATSEMKLNLRKSARAGMLLGGAALMGFLGVVCLITTFIVALAIVLPLWLADLLMAVMLAMGAGGAFLVGRMRLDEVDFPPQKTMENLKDNIDWVKTRVG
jgi:uncharacterized membrane protein YqjE